MLLLGGAFFLLEKVIRDNINDDCKKINQIYC